MKGYEDLLKTVKAVQSSGIMEITEQAILDYQDMIGHSTEEQLDELSKGTYKEAFYRVYGAAAGVIEAIRYYRRHSPAILEDQERIADLESVRDNLLKHNKSMEKEVEDWKDRTEKCRKAWEDAEKEKIELAKRIDELEAKNQELKAKLYDLMTA